MISIDMIFLGTGSVLAYAFDAAFEHVNQGWRYMIGLGAIPSILLGVFLFLCKFGRTKCCISITDLMQVPSLRVN
jgi:hypothetical protein